MSAGLLDTSVVVDWHDPQIADALPDELSISAITLAELTAGTHLAKTPGDASRRQARLQEVEARFEPIPFDGGTAVSYGLIAAAVVAHGRTTRRRFADLLIAATAHAQTLALYTRNPDDFAGLEGLVEIVSV